MQSLKKLIKDESPSSQYVVRELQQASSIFEFSKALDTKTYPTKSLKGNISSFLILLQSSENVKLWDHIKSKFGYIPPEYQIIIYQNSSSHNFVGFVLHEGGDLHNEKEAFAELHNSLSPLLHEGTVLLTAQLLKEIILPVPLSRSSMIVHLVDVIQSNPSAHSEWYTIIQLLEKSTCSVPCSNDSESNVPTPADTLSKTLKRKIFAPLKHKVLAVRTSTSDLNSTDYASPDVSVESVDDDDAMSENVWLKFRRQTVIKNRKGIQRTVEKTRSVDLDCKESSFDSLDKEGKTPLMISVEKGYTKSTFNFLLAGGNPNAQEKATGNTALHLAVKNRNSTLVKLLIAFNADVSIRNIFGESPLDFAMKTKDSTVITLLEESGKLQAKANAYNLSNNKFSKQAKFKSSQFLLSLDGGGIRGFNTIQILIAIENRLKQLKPNSQPLISYFDYVAGTSAGSIIGTVLMYTDSDAKTGRYLVHKVITDVFKKNLSERGARIDQFLQDIFGPERVMGDLEPSQRMIITATLADRSPNKLHLMTSYGESRDGHPGPQHRKVWEAVRISSAAPLYFPPFDSHFLDGGLMANNPTIDAMVEIMQQNKKEKKEPKLGFILSLGTGFPPTKPVNNIEVFIPGMSLKTLSSIPSNLRGFGSFFNHLVTQVTQSDGQEVDRARTLCDSLGYSYFRLSPPLQSDIDPSTTDEDVIADMLYNTRLYILSISDQIDIVTKCLLSKH